MKDETKAGLLCAAWLTVFTVGLFMANAIGYLIAGFITVIFLIVLYASYQNEKQTERAERYRKKFHDEYYR